MRLFGRFLIYKVNLQVNPFPSSGSRRKAHWPVTSSITKTNILARSRNTGK
jgi:hypothetical protein